MNFVRAFLLPYRAVLIVLRDSKLIRFALVPWLINIGVFIGALTAFGYLDRWLMAKLTAWMGTGWWVPVTAWILGLLLFAAFGAGLILTFTFLCGIIGGAFSEQLSFHAERAISGAVHPSPEGTFYKIWARSAVESIKGLLFFLTVWAVLLLLNLIPIAGVLLFGITSTLWTAWCLTFEFTAPAYERRGLRFAEKRTLLTGNIGRSLGLGISILLLTMIPFVNLIFLPFAVVAGTLWAVDTDLRLNRSKTN
jgi:CysZ protein